MNWRRWSYALLVAAALMGHLAIAHFLANTNEPDGMIYSCIATNVLERQVYSVDTAAPYAPTLIRLPGYPIFIAAVYKLFGDENKEAVRIVQAVVSLCTCLLVAVLAWLWEPADERKQRTAVVAFVLAAVCPFTVIYAGVFLTETLTIFLCVAMMMAATLAFCAGVRKKATAWWIAAGLLAGGIQLVRPDGGLFAAAVGFTLVGCGLFRRGGDETGEGWGRRILRVFKHGALFSCAFVLVLTPWVVRNARVFHVFQPLAPRDDFLPGEFVPRGYFRWYGTWADSERYLMPLFYQVSSFYSLDPNEEMDFDDIPPQAFDSPEEHARVEALFAHYNHPGGPADYGNAAMTSEVDAAFGQIAAERIARSPLRQYVKLPLSRMVSLWVVPHAQYYPFEGELFPLDELSHARHRQFWLPLFFVLTCAYTLGGVIGGWILWRTGGSQRTDARRWVWLLVLLILPRLMFLSTVEHTEPRYTVEFFPFLSVLCGMVISRVFRAGKSDVPP